MPNTKLWQRIRNINSSNNTLGLFITLIVGLSLYLLYGNLFEIAAQLLTFSPGIPLWIVAGWALCIAVSFVHYLTLALDGFFNKKTILTPLIETPEEKEKRLKSTFVEERRFENYLTLAGGVIFGILGFWGTYLVCSDLLKISFGVIRVSAAGAGIGSRWGRTGDIFKNLKWLRNYELSIAVGSIAGIILTIFIGPASFVDGMIFFFGFVAGISDLGRSLDTLFEGKTIANFFIRFINPKKAAQLDQKALEANEAEAYRVGPYEKITTIVGVLVAAALGVFLFSHGFVPMNLAFLIAPSMPSVIGGGAYIFLVIGVFSGPWKRIAGRMVDAIMKDDPKDIEEDAIELNTSKTESWFSLGRAEEVSYEFPAHSELSKIPATNSSPVLN